MLHGVVHFVFMYCVASDFYSTQLPVMIDQWNNTRLMVGHLSLHPYLLCKGNQGYKLGKQLVPHQEKIQMMTSLKETQRIQRVLIQWKTNVLEGYKNFILASHIFFQFEWL